MRILFFLALQLAAFAVKAQNSPYKSYLFVYFTGNEKGQEAIHFALSKDGYHYTALNQDQPVISSDTISSTGGIRDPHILRGDDGNTFYMVATDMVAANGWNSNRAMVLMRSTDLIHWRHAVVNIQRSYAGQEKLERVWAPQTIYDKKKKKYMIYWAMKYSDGPDMIYYAYANKNFTALEGSPRQLFVSPGNKSCIDPDIIEKDGKYHLFFKTEGNGNGIKQAISNNLTGGYVQQDEYLQQTDKPVEGSSVFSLNDGSGYILMYDMYTSGKYQFTFSKDLRHFKAVDQEISMDFHPRHGTVMSITGKEAERLAAKWGSKKINVLVVTGGHGFEHKPFYNVFDSIPGITYDTLTQPQANALIASPEVNKYDVLVFYDMFDTISPAQQEAYIGLLKKGASMIFLHHSLVGYQHWPEFIKIVGGQYHTDAVVVNGDTLHASYEHDVKIPVKVEDKNHPVTQGIGDFEIVDEVYGGVEILPQVKPLLSTTHPKSMRYLAWINHYGNSDVIYIQPGHGPSGYSNPNYRKLIRQAIEWSARH
jgi:type 1 glutamine amidotransferase